MTELLERTVPSVLHIQGALRAPVDTHLSERVQALLARGELGILLDLTRLSDIDAAGVGQLARTYAATSAAGGILQIANPSRRVRRLLEVAGLWSLLPHARGNGRHRCPRALTVDG